MRVSIDEPGCCGAIGQINDSRPWADQRRHHTVGADGYDPVFPDRQRPCNPIVRIHSKHNTMPQNQVSGLLSRMDKRRYRYRQRGQNSPHGLLLSYRLNCYQREFTVPEVSVTLRYPMKIV
jgi:hypothetical protein